MNSGTDPRSESRVERIRALVQDRLRPRRLEVRDDSAAHAGHAGARGGKGHFQLLIVADCFTGRTLVERQRLVHDALADMLRDEIHALSMITKTPDELV